MTNRHQGIRATASVYLWSATAADSRPPNRIYPLKWRSIGAPCLESAIATRDYCSLFPVNGNCLFFSRCWSIRHARNPGCPLRSKRRVDGWLLTHSLSGPSNTFPPFFFLTHSTIYCVNEKVGSRIAESVLINDSIFYNSLFQCKLSLKSTGFVPVV